MDGRLNRRSKTVSSDGLVWMEGLSNRRSKAAFSDGLVWIEGLTVEVKLCLLTD